MKTTRTPRPFKSEPRITLITRIEHVNAKRGPLFHPASAKSALSAVVFVLLATWPVFAQDPLALPEPIQPPPPPREMMMAPPPPPEEQFGQSAVAPTGSFVSLWLERVKAVDVQDYERLQQMRKDDPVAFREELHKRLREERVMSKFNDHPKFRTFMKGLPPPERDALATDLAPGEGQPGPRPRMGRINPEIAQLEQKTMEMSRIYRETTDESQKLQIKKDLRNELNHLFELREIERRKEIARIEQTLTTLKTSLDQRQTNRNLIISRRLKELTEGDDLKW